MNASALRGSRGRTVLLLLGVLLLSVRPSWASCSPPEISVDRPEVASGERIVVSGVGWSDRCPEPREGGCGSDDQSDPSALADIDVSLVSKSAPRSPIALGSIDARGDYEFELVALVPKSTPPGHYTIEARTGDHVNEPPVPIAVTP